MNNIEFYRKLNNMSRKELANKVHVSVQTIAAYEKEIRTPNVQILCDIARIFGVSMDCLLVNAVRTPCHEAVIVNDAMSKMTPDNRQKVLDIIKDAYPVEFGINTDMTSKNTDCISTINDETDEPIYDKTTLSNAASEIWNIKLTSYLGKKLDRPLLDMIRRITNMLIHEAEVLASHERENGKISRKDIYNARNILLKRKKTVFSNDVYEFALNELIDTTTNRLIENLSIANQNDIIEERECD